MKINADLDPHRPSRGIISPSDEVEEVILDLEQPQKKLRIGKYLDSGTKKDLISLLSINLGIFAWSQEDMIGIDPGLACHMLNIDPKVKLLDKREGL